MKSTVTLLLTSLTFIFATAAYADHGGHGEKEHQHSIFAHYGVVGATPPGIKNSAVYFTVENSSHDDVMITSVKSNASNIAEMHTHSFVDGAMSMRKIQSVHLPANKKTIFKPSGLHVMLFDLNQPLTVGKTIELTLFLSNGESINVTANIVMPSDITSVQINRKGMKAGDGIVKESHSHH